MSLVLLHAQRPTLINIILVILCLFVINSLYNFAASITMMYPSDSQLSVGYVAITSINMVIPTGILLISIIGLLTRKHWSWWFAGIIGTSGVFGFFIALLQNYQLSQSGPGISLFESSPELMVRVVIGLVINLVLLIVLFRPVVMEYLGIESVSSGKSLGIMAALGILIPIAFGIMMSLLSALIY